ncbi:MAG: response regulator [Nitrospinae bacterium]|nr:response regulator [Nitrospinota bacterium]
MSSTPLFTAKMNILVVDDEEYMRSALKALLETWGYQTTIASNGQEALDAILEKEPTPHSFSLIITDITMPVMNGVRLIEEVRKLERLVPVLVMSGNIDRETAACLVRHEMVQILHKPFIPDDLMVIAMGVFSSGALRG